MVRSMDHRRDQVLEPRAQGEGEVVDRVLGDVRDFVVGGDLGHDGSEVAWVEGGAEGLFAGSVFVGAVGVVVFVGTLEGLFFGLESF